MSHPPRVIVAEPAELEVSITQWLGWSFGIAAACLLGHALTL